MKHTSFTNIKKIMSQRYVTIYTVQHVAVLNTLANEGKIYTPKNKVYHDSEDRKTFKRPYDWMMQQLSMRIKNFSGNYPVWSWVQKPSDKEISCHFNTNPVLIKARVPVNRCVFSDFVRWHDVLNDQYSPWNLRELQDVIDEKKFTKDQIKSSWSNIFKLSKPTKEIIKHITGSRGFVLQVCVDEIHDHEILEIRTYDYVPIEFAADDEE